MSAADEAYEAAVAEIKRVRAAGETALRLEGASFRALDRIPDEIAGIEGLTVVDLDNTRVADLAPLAGLTALQTLWLGNTRVADLRPIRNMRPPGHSPFDGLAFGGSPFAAATDETRRLAAIENRADRTRATLAFLNTLPPWPEPLPWERPPEPPPPDPDPAVPLVAGPDGIALAPAPLKPEDADDGVRPILFEALRERATELYRLMNRDEAAGRFGERLTTLLDGGLARLVPLRLHIEVESLRRYAAAPGAPSTRRWRVSWAMCWTSAPA